MDSLHFHNCRAILRKKRKRCTAMMYASDFREKARDALRGHWGKAVAVGLVATLLSGGFTVASNGTGGESSGYLSFASHSTLITLTTVAVVMSLFAIVLGGAVNLGWCRFHTNLVKDTEDACFNDLFAHFDHLGRGFVMNLVMSLFIVLWSLLFIIPGIIATYNYAMVPYLMAEFPELKTMDAIRESKRLMQGNKWRLFCLQMSFFGWALLCVFTLGIGNLWLTPYMRTAEAAFYMHITGRMKEEKENPVEW